MFIEGLTFNELFCRVLWQLMHRSMREFWRFAKEQGLSMTQWLILRQVHANAQGGCNISLISEHLGVTSAAVSQTLDLLVQQGLVSRTEDPQDRRNKRILLTEEGERLLRRSMEARQSWVADLEASLTPEEKEVVSQALQILAEKLAPFDRG